MLSDCLLRTINTLHFALSLKLFSRHFLRRYNLMYIELLYNGPLCLEMPLLLAERAVSHDISYSRVYYCITFAATYIFRQCIVIAAERENLTIFKIG